MFDSHSTLTTSSRLIRHVYKSLGFDQLKFRAYKTYFENNNYQVKINELTMQLNSLSNEYSTKYQEYQNKLNSMNSLSNVALQKLNNLENWFEQNNIKNGYFGIDQGIANKNIFWTGTVKHASQLYMNIKNKIMQQYNMSANDASRIITYFDSTGACSYAAIANEIFATYKNNSQLFERDFGYSMYTNVDGKTTLNGFELMVDLYMFTNHTNNGGNLITNFNGRTVLTQAALSGDKDLFGRKILNTKSQKYLSSFAGKSINIIDKFLKSKNPNLNFDSYVLASSSNVEITKDEMNKIKSNIFKEVSVGKQVGLGIYDNKNYEPIRMKNLTVPGKDHSTNSWSEGKGAGHAVFVTNMNENGFIVSSWGEKFLIPYDDLRKGSFVINIDSIGGI